MFLLGVAELHQCQVMLVAVSLLLNPGRQGPVRLGCLFLEVSFVFLGGLLGVLSQFLQLLGALQGFCLADLQFFLLSLGFASGKVVLTACLM